MIKKNYIYNFLIADDLYPLNYIHSKGRKCRTYRMKIVFPIFVSETLSNFRSLPPFFVKESLWSLHGDPLNSMYTRDERYLVYLSEVYLGTQWDHVEVFIVAATIPIIFRDTFLVARVKSEISLCRLTFAIYGPARFLPLVSEWTICGRVTQTRV